MSQIVWSMDGRRTRYWVRAEAYRNAHDGRTFVARIEDAWASAPARVYDIKFGFKTLRAAKEWARAQRRGVRNKIQRAQRSKRPKEGRET